MRSKSIRSHRGAPAVWVAPGSARAARRWAALQATGTRARSAVARCSDADRHLVLAQRKYDETLVWARELSRQSEACAGGSIHDYVYLKIGDVHRFAAWTVSKAIELGLSEERVAVLKQVTADMQQVYATAGLSGVRRFLVEHTRTRNWTSTRC